MEHEFIRGVMRGFMRMGGLRGFWSCCRRAASVCGAGGYGYSGSGGLGVKLSLLYIPPQLEQRAGRKRDVGGDKARGGVDPTPILSAHRWNPKQIPKQTKDSPPCPPCLFPTTYCTRLQSPNMSPRGGILHSVIPGKPALGQNGRRNDSGS